MTTETALVRPGPISAGDAVLVAGLLLLSGAVSLGAGAFADLGYLAWIIIALQVVPLLLRRQAPLLVAGVVAAGCLLQVASTTTPHVANVAVLIVVYSAAAYGTTLESRLILALGLLGAILATLSWASGAPLRFYLGLLPFIGMFVVLAWGLGDVVRRRRAVSGRQAEQDRALARDEEQRARLAAQSERASIAREMHDVVAHSLAVVVVQADGALYAARTTLDQPPDPTRDRAALEQAAATLETLAGTARSSLDETRRLVGVLRDKDVHAEYAPSMGLAQLDELAARVQDSGPAVHVAVRGPIDDLPKDVDLAAYRVAQEALTNVLKHAGPDVAVDVDVLRTPAVLQVRITDDGAGDVRSGADSGDGDGHGIIGMTERIEVIGGSFQAGPRPRGGWQVVATIPIPVSDSTSVTPGENSP